MSEDFGNGVSRTLSAIQHQFQLVVWQANKPPLDSELNLISQVDLERSANVVRSQMHSGFMLDPYAADQDFVVSESWSNFFKLGLVDSTEQGPTLWANVNGWIVPVTGTDVPDGDTSNRLNLFPAPTSDSRIDFVFLEVWRAQLSPNPSAVNKPSASTFYKYGNVKYGGTNFPDDMEDPAVGFETTERLQLQYRLRVVGRGAGLGESVDLASFPSGLDDPNVLGQGGSADPVVGFPFLNMGETLGDPGLWRSGDGDASNSLGTVDGYVYAIPVCGVFRRNSASFVSRTNGGNANQNGSFNRNPNTAAITDPVEATRVFTEVTLTNSIGAGTTGAVQVEGLAGSGLDNSDMDWSSTFLVIDGEVIGLTSVSTTTTPGTITIRTTGGRGRNGTQARPHAAGGALQFFNFRADLRFADQIHPEDILDLRMGVTPGQWDFQALLAHNLGKLFSDTLRSSYKQAAGSDTEGPVIVEVDTLWANGSFAVPNQTTALDGPDGIRTVFSDAAVVESNVTLLLKPSDSSPNEPVAISDYTAGASNWDVAASFVPDGWQTDGAGWQNGTIIRLFIGGATGDGGARATVRTAADSKIVRFVTPREYWLTRDEIDVATPGIGSKGLQTPFRLRLLEEDWGEPPSSAQLVSNHPGPMYPLPEHNFELPFIVLGGVVNAALRDTSVDALVAGSSPSGLSQVRFAGLDFDVPGSWFAAGAAISLTTEGISNLLLHGKRSLYDMLTAGGRDRTGRSSELYLVLSGDTTNSTNAGVLRVIGAGTVGYTTENGATGEDLVVERVGFGDPALIAASGLTAEVRSQYTHTEDGVVAGDGAAAVIVLTDLEGTLGGTEFPWAGLLSLPATSEMVVDTTILYGPSRGGTARVASHIDRIAMVGVNAAQMVREAPTGLDPSFDDEAGVPEGELYFPSQHIQTWNRLPSLGLSAPWAPNYGEGSYLNDQRREAEVFLDPGSKTVMLRPYRRVALALWRNQITNGSGRLIPATYAQGASIGVAVDGGGLFPPGADYGYAFPHEFMPRFGRQDIPVHQTTGITGPVYYGINHLFGDSQSYSDDVFRVIGGADSDTTVLSAFIQTGASSGRVYGEWFTMGGTSQGYQGRIYSDVNVNSTDLPAQGLKGIQLPPFVGIARLYGVYDLREFSGEGAWNSDRATLSAALGRPTNLLKSDADKQTLFIAPGGGEDVTGNPDDHTYVVPADAIDVSLSGQFVDGETFDDLEFVVECVVFGFSRGFINKNNYILARLNLPTTSGLGLDGTTVPALGDNLACILPLPLPFNEQLYTTYRRTAYQGDPYMTRDGSTRTTSDYAHRYGQIPPSGAAALGMPIQQFDSTNDFQQVPEIPNPRALEILASMSFWTTLGTGKIGGPIYAGTPLDVGHITNQGLAPTRIPPESSDPIWQSETRTFTQGADESSSRGLLTINVLENTATSAGETVNCTRNGVTYSLESDLAGPDGFIGAGRSTSAEALANAINASTEIRNDIGIQAYWSGGTIVEIVSLIPGAEGNESQIRILPATGSRIPTGFGLVNNSAAYGLSPTTSDLKGGVDKPMNGTLNASAQTPIRMAGLTERLPLGILLQDADFIGEDPLRNGTSALQLQARGGSDAPGGASPILGDEEYGRIQGGGIVGMADGSILQYTPWSLAVTSGTRKFRLFRGGGSSYVLTPTPHGGPVGFSAGGLPEGDDPVVKGAVLAGRAFLVRNYKEEAFAATSVRTYGDELQMVIVTSGHVGDGPLCAHGYAMDGQISPTGYGEGLAAADRYRLEGKPLVAGHSEASPNPDISGELAPFPGEDAANPDPCA